MKACDPCVQAGNLPVHRFRCCQRPGPYIISFTPLPLKDFCWKKRPGYSLPESELSYFGVILHSSMTRLIPLV